MELNNLQYTKGSRGHKRRTYGRGFSSGLGKTSGRGQKGQHSRKSGNVRIGFEGGQTPIYRKIPKVGFNSFNYRKNIYAVGMDAIINAKLTIVNREELLKHHLIGKCNFPIKVIGSSKPLKDIGKLSFEVELMSKPLMEKLTKAGCKVNLIKESKKPVTKKKVAKKVEAKPAEKPAVKKETKPVAKKATKK